MNRRHRAFVDLTPQVWEASGFLSRAFLRWRAPCDVSDRLATGASVHSQAADLHSTSVPAKRNLVSVSGFRSFVSRVSREGLPERNSKPESHETPERPTKPPKPARRSQIRRPRVDKDAQHITQLPDVLTQLALVFMPEPLHDLRNIYQILRH